MPSSTRKPSRQPAPPTGSTTTPDIDPRWLLKMLGLVLVVALFCGYLTLCLLFYQGQWQFVLHPDTAKRATPAAVNLSFEDVAFDYTEAGQAQLHGWWIPAAANTRYANDVVLYLRRGDDSLAADLPRLQQIHDAGLNVFAFDYRGFGQSAGPHPTEQRMREDAAAAWLYVTQKRGMPETQIIPYGEGVGGALAVQLAADHRRVPALVLDQPGFDAMATVLHDPRATLIPVRWLFHERFEIGPYLINNYDAHPMVTSVGALSLPKLIFAEAQIPEQTLNAVAPPKFIVHLDGLSADAASAARTQSLSRFLDEYLPASTVLPQ